MSKILKGYLDRIKKLEKTEYAELTPSNLAEAKAAFLADPRQRTPLFEYNGERQTSEYLQGQLTELEQIQEEALNDPQLSPSEKTLITTVLEANCHSTDLLLQASLYRKNPNPTARAKFQLANTELYGEPDRDLALALLDYQLNQLKVENFTTEEQEIYQRLLVNLPDGREDYNAKLFVPKDSTVQRLAEIYRQKMGWIFRHLPEDKAEFTPEEVVDLINEIIDEELRPWSGTKFHAVLAEKKTVFDVDQVERVVNVPRHRVKGPYTREVVMSTLMGHEFIHMLRGVPFENCGVPALSYGFPKYVESEEGITIAIEAALKGKYEPINIHHYVNIVLAHVFKYDFRKVFEVWRDLHYLLEINPQASAEEKAASFKKAEDRAFADTNRAIKGNGILPYFKDTIYFLGSQKVWQHVENIFESNGNIDEMIEKFFWLGKVGIFNEKHLAIARAAKAGEYGNPVVIPWDK